MLTEQQIRARRDDLWETALQIEEEFHAGGDVDQELLLSVIQYGTAVGELDIILEDA